MFRYYFKNHPIGFVFLVACSTLLVLLAWDIITDMKYIGNYDAYMNVAKEKYPGDLILQQPQIGQFVRIDSKGNLISFIVWDIDDKTIVGEETLINLNDLKQH